ncbi:diguanylate cyclase [Pedomonas sp. V897]|uniref:GGDEF domain-containing protein n=1 Tax=Pedomonas sp. V897 TaxID=3446482 RepID=UPI003EE00E03
MTRPLGFLAVVWPANAILLGLFVTWPELARRSGWLSALLGYLLAGNLSGDPLATNLWLTAANLGGVACAWLGFQLLDEEDRRLRRPMSMLRFFLICVSAATGAALIGCGLAPGLLDRSVLTGLVYWFTAELINYTILLPVLLTMDLETIRGLPDPLRRPWKEVVRHLAPLASLCASVAAAIVVGGPGAIAFSVPALLWCSMTYRLFPMSVIMLAFSVVMLQAQGSGFMVTSDHYDFLDGTASFRVGIAVLVLGPLTVTNIMTLQRVLFDKLERAATLDSLTGILGRHAFLSRSRAVLDSLSGDHGFALLMIDIDHFKQINDRYGHQAGDVVIRAVTAAIAGELRKADLFGRLGGEEFAVTLDATDPLAAEALAERVRRAVEDLRIDIDRDAPLAVTISIGLTHHRRPPAKGLSQSLGMADAALYRAKAEGRNRVCSRLAEAL